MQTDYGFLTLLPPLVALICCFATKRVLLSLFIGVLTGGVIISSGNPISAFVYCLQSIINSMKDEWNAHLLLFNFFMGSGVALIWRLGGSKALSKWAKKRIKNRNQAGIAAWLLGIMIFINDYINAAIVGNVFRDIFDEMKISKEKFSYIVDSTAAPVATFFISDWTAFQVGMVQSGIDAAGIKDISAFEGFLIGIPMNFYCILAVLMVGVLLITKRDFGPMLEAENRVLTTGKTFSDNAKPMLDVADEMGEAKDTKPMLVSFFLPILVLIVVTLIGFYWTGKGPDKTFVQILGDADAAKALLWGAFSMTLTGAIIALSSRIMNVSETMDTIIDGFKLMLLACAILVMAWTLGGVAKEMKLSDFVIQLIGNNLHPGIMPLAIFLFGCLIAFATGTSWGTMTILTPIAIPLAYKLSGDPVFAVMISGVVFSGAIFGDHCSPISDTTVLSSIFSGADHMDHVSTQIPYAITCASVTGILYLIYGFMGISPFIVLPVGLFMLIGLVYFLSNRSKTKLATRIVTKA